MTAPDMPGQTVSRVVVELECGVTVYPAREPGGRWRAVWYEDGARRQCEAATEDRLAARLEKVTERLAADAPNLERPGADLIAWYLSPSRHPAGRAWSAKHADTQRRLCERFAAPGHRRGHLPGHQDLPHAADRQRRAHCRRRRPGARDALRAGRSGDRGRVPDQPAAGRCSTPGPRSRRADIAPGSPRPCHRRVPVAAPWPLPWCWPSRCRDWSAPRWGGSRWLGPEWHSRRVGCGEPRRSAPGAAAHTRSAAVLRSDKQGDRGTREGLGNSYAEGVRLGPR